MLVAFVCGYSNFSYRSWPYLILNAYSKYFYGDEEDICNNNIFVHDNNECNMEESYLWDDHGKIILVENPPRKKIKAKSR